MGKNLELQCGGKHVSSPIRVSFAPALLAMLVVIASASAQEAPAQDKSAGYRLHAGDSITVSVWKELDLQRKLYIRPDGRF
jgi:hypothetical protein